MIACNTSPIYYLHKIGHLQVLEALFTEISIPMAVVHELDEGKRLGYNAPDVRDFGWIKQHSVTVPAELGALGIGSGETEAIALALNNNTVKLILLDDGEARRAALERKLPVMGTVGVLVTLAGVLVASLAGRLAGLVASPTGTQLKSARLRRIQGQRHDPRMGAQKCWRESVRTSGGRQRERGRLRRKRLMAARPFRAKALAFEDGHGADGSPR